MKKKTIKSEPQVQIRKRMATDGFLMNVPSFLRITNARVREGPIKDHGGLIYMRVPSIGKYVAQVKIRIAAATPTEMEKHINAFNKWADKTPLI